MYVVTMLPSGALFDMQQMHFLKLLNRFILPREVIDREDSREAAKMTIIIYSTS